MYTFLDFPFKIFGETYLVFKYFNGETCRYLENPSININKNGVFIFTRGFRYISSPKRTYPGLKNKYCLFWNRFSVTLCNIHDFCVDTNILT